MRAVLKLVRRSPQPARKPGTWPATLGPPVYPLDNLLAMRAHSILHSMDVREPRGLTPSEAIDVIRWNGQFV